MADALIHLGVPAALKARWVRESRAAGMRLTDWIVEKVEYKMAQKIIHLALAADGKVLAHFSDGEDAAVWCMEHGACHVPYNTENRDQAPVPLVGTVYRA